MTQSSQDTNSSEKNRDSSRFRAINPHAAHWAYMITITILLIMAGFGIWWRSIYRQQMLQQEREVTKTRLYPYTKSLESSINRRFALLAGMTAFIHSDTNKSHLDAHFESFAASLYAQASGIRNFSIFPGGEAKFVYPVQGNEVVIGHNLLKDERPNVRADVQHAIETRRLTLSGPYELRQGGWGLVARQAIFFNNQFWGFSAMVLDVLPILDEAGISDSRHDLRFAIRGQDGTIFFGDSEVFDSNPVMEEVLLPEATWQVAVVPAGGWGSTVQDRLNQMDIAIGVIGSLLILVAISFITYQNRLQREVKSRTQSLAQQRDLLNRMMETSPVGITVVDRNGLISYANQQAENILGLRKEQLAKRTYNAPTWQHMHLDGTSFLDDEQPFSRVKTTLSAVYNVQQIISNSDGLQKCLSINSAPLFDNRGKFDGMVATIEDITEKIQAENALRESETRYRTLVEHASDGIFISDQEGNFLDVNTVGCSMTGYSHEELLKLNRVDLITAENLARLPLNDDELKNGKTVLTERQLKHKDGFIINIEINSKMLANGNYLGMVRDITERIQIQTELEAERELLRICHYAANPSGLMRDLSAFFQKLTDCRAVGVRLHKGEDYPYFETRGFPQQFVEMERYLCMRDPQGQIQRDSAGNPILECMCGNILCGRFDPQKPFFTKNGSFWTNNTSELLRTTTDTDRQARTRNRCNGEGYESVALIPLRSRGITYGLFQFNDPRPGRFNPARIAQLEHLVDYVASALATLETAQELQDSEERYHQLVDASPSAIIVFQQGKYVFANPAGLNMLGYAGLEELRQQNPIDNIHPDSRPLVMQRIQNGLKSTLHNPFELKVFRKDGSVLFSEATTVFISFDEQPALLLIAQDITERKQAEETRRQLEEKFTKVFQLSPDSISITRMPNGEFIDVNEGFVRASGFSRDEVIGKTSTELDIWVNPQDRENIIEEIRQKGEVRDYEVLIRDKSGEIFTNLMTIKKIEIDNEQFLLSNLRDITERKKSEESRRQLEEKFTKAFHISPDSININRLVDGLYIDINEGFTSMTGYTADEVIGKTSLEIDIWVNPADRKRLVEGLLKNGEYLNLEAPFRIKNGQIKTCLMSAKIIEINGETCILSITRDITDHLLAQQALLKQIGVTTRRTWELESLAEISASLRTAQNRDELTSLVIKEAVAALQANAGAIALVENNQLTFSAAVMEFSVLAGKTLPQNDGVLWNVIRSGEMIQILTAEAWKMFPINILEEYLHGALPFRVIVPLQIEQHTTGLIILGYDQPQEYDEVRNRLLTAVADMAGSALHRMGAVENLQRLVSDRTHELDSIYRVTSAASEAVNLHQGLHNALQRALDAIGAPMGNIFLLSDDSQSIQLAADIGYPPDVHKKLLNLKIKDSAQGWVIEHNEPLILTDLASDPRSLWEKHANIKIYFIGMPMRVQERVVGAISAIKPDGQPLELEEMMLLSFIADHLGLLVENMRLSRQAEAAAIMEERARLARELHDSVTQSLYSATLFAEGGRNLLQQNRINEVDQYLAQLGQISHQALKEMRLLVFELRSSALAGSDLADALQQRLEAVEERAGIHTRLEIDELPELPPRVEENVYRIAIEALNNILKHANAHTVQVKLTNIDNVLSLSITDDGSGFDAQTDKPSAGVGLASMRERAQQIGGILAIASQPGIGTIITLQLPIANGYNLNRSPDVKGNQDGL